MHWRRKWQATPVFLPGESQEQRSLEGCHLWGHTELDTTDATKKQQQHRAGGRCYGIGRGPHRGQLHSPVINLYGAPGSKGRVAYVGCFEGLSSQKRTLILTIKGPVVTVGQFLTKILKTGARLGKFGWDGEKGRGRGIRARLQVQSLPRGNREPQIHALGSKDTLILKTED